MVFFFFNDTATTEIYTLSLHDALPIWRLLEVVEEPDQTRLLDDDPLDLLLALFRVLPQREGDVVEQVHRAEQGAVLEEDRSEEHTSELQSRQYLVCRLLLEKKNNANTV